MQHLRGWWGFTTLHHTLERNGRPRFLSRRQNLANDGGECTPEVVGRDWFCSDGKTVFSGHGVLESWTNMSHPTGESHSLTDDVQKQLFFWSWMFDVQCIFLLVNYCVITW